MKHAIAIIDPFGTGVHLKQAAIDAGYDVIGVFTIPMDVAEHTFSNTEAEFLSGCSEVIHGSSQKEILPKLLKSAHIIQGVVPGNESGVEIADELADSMGLIGNNLVSSPMRRDKLEMRRGLRDAGLSSPDFARCSTLEELKSFAQKHTYPLVIKTPKGAGTHNVFICENWKELKEGFEKILSSLNVFGAKTAFALAEEYIDGNEYIVDLFCDGKKAYVTDVWVYHKGLPGGPKNLCWSCNTVDPHSVPHVVEYAKKAAFATGIEWGPAHAEVKDDPKKGPTLVEIAARLSGAGLPNLIRKASNFDLFLGFLDLFTSGTTNIPKEISLNKSFAIAFSPVFKEGIVASISGIEEIQKLPSYIKHTLHLEKGSKCVKSEDLYTTPLAVYLGHSDPAQLEKDVAQVHQLFTVQVES
jgi:biotin carboxylase